MIENNAPTKILKHINVQVFHRDFLFLIFNKDGPGQDADLQVQIDTFFDKYIFVVFPVVALHQITIFTKKAPKTFQTS